MKKLVSAFLLAILVAFAPVVAQAAGTCVAATPDHVPGQSVTIYQYTCTGDADGGTIDAYTTEAIDGWIMRVEVNPGTTGPTAGYDLTFVNNEIDVMKGALADLSATAAAAFESPQPYVRGAVAMTFANTTANSAVIVIRISVLR